MPLDEKKKAGLISMEFGAYMTQTGQCKGYDVEHTIYKGTAYSIYRNVDDPDGKGKAKAVHKAIERIYRNGFTLPECQIRIYCTNAYEAQNRAFHRDPAWGRVCYVILAKDAFKGGRVESISKHPPAGYDHATITCIHEIGHNLHELAAGDEAFWAGDISRGKATTSGQVSAYAGNNKKEFVAEVFAGMNVGKKYTKEVIDEYISFNGPSGTKFPANAIDG
jgi:hypothetical protein